jgi:predicted ATP-binding protein involved in virulence
VLPPSDLDPSARRVLWHYLNDVQEKFDVFDDLLQRVELFKSIINSRFLYKHFLVDEEEGFIFVTEGGELVPPGALSSGEQHELVLAFELLFRVKEGSLILIDEPELSLHVTWQHRFLEDMERISKLANLDFIVATHSPSIIHNQPHLMVPLGG